MCGIAGVVRLDGGPVPDLGLRLALMNRLQRHRGPDGAGTWEHPAGGVGLAHRRLAVIDLATGGQPMTDGSGNWVAFNGEIYNFRELREELGGNGVFTTASDTEVILRAYRRWGHACLDRLRGMFAFALWDEAAGELFLARDRFGIKPLYHARVGDTLYVASEIKTILPFLPAIETDLEGLKDYVAFQFCLGEKTLFRGVRQLLPGHFAVAARGGLSVRRYWEVFYDLDWSHTDRHFRERVRACLLDSVRLHLVSDVPVGGYVSGGTDSGILAAVASRMLPGGFMGFNGRFGEGPEYDESPHARELAAWAGFPLVETEITARDFARDMESVVYHLDHPVAGPGSFPQFCVSRTAAAHRKVVLGGQGGDEVFGGYARYLLAYFEQCIKGAIDGTMRDGTFVVTYESIIPNLSALRRYKPLIQEFWREGLFEEMDRRYFRLVNRAGNLQGEIRAEALGDYNPFETFREIFQAGNVNKVSYFDRMTHFDFKTLLPALLQVEDRMSMAHGLESRVPFLDHPLVELAATIPSDIKFRDGKLKKVLLETMADCLPPGVLARQDKMGFPVPLNEWLSGELRDFVRDLFDTDAARSRPYFDVSAILANLESEPRFGRKVWGLVSLELWHRLFHDRQGWYASALEKEEHP
jgi:asparagine synthase (glutamine-hydrolysing)